VADPAQFLTTLSIWAIPVLLAITLHEVAHGWVARAFGDPTAARLGRLSLNPLKHVDPVGTVLVPAVLLFLGGFLFGWAKPVPVNMHNLPKPRQHMAWVAAAGPAANLVMALGWASLLKVASLVGADSAAWQFLALMSMAGIIINLVLMILNLLPLPPLDGGRVLAGVVPPATARILDRIEPWGLAILIGLLALGILGQIIAVPMGFAESTLYQLFGINRAALF
jgi:Zn-dependent protease